MSKRMVKVSLPHRQPEGLLRLAQRILEKSQADESVTIIDKADITELQNLFTKAETDRNKSIQLREESEKEMQTARILLGMEKGQTASTPDTITYLIAKIRDTLLAHFRGHEEELSEYGFNVVTSSFVPKGKATIPSEK